MSPGAHGGALLVLALCNVMAHLGHRCECADVRLSTQSNPHRNVSELLDNLLRGYDNSVRPDFGGPPAVVEVDMVVRSMGPISEVDMTYSMDCYFRQTWVDRRLAFRGSKETLALSISMLKRIWKPDTYFYNGKQSYLHTITTPNKFVRLYQDGRVLYSSRLTIKAGCPMNLEDFPMDTQRCPLKFGSFGYTTQDVLYHWNPARQVEIAEDMKMSQFDLIATPSANQTDLLKAGEYSMLLVSFHLQRHMGNFLIQVYGPCVLLVVLSWVSFWLNREATADRVSLGITTVLTMTFLGLEARTDLPKVPYPTALDFFVFLSFVFIFATIIQFAVVHYFTKYGSGEVYFNTELNSETDSSDSDDWDSESPLPAILGRGRRRTDLEHAESERMTSGVSLVSPGYAANGDTCVEVIPLSAPSCLSREPPTPWLCFSAQRSPPRHPHGAFPLALREQRSRCPEPPLASIVTSGAGVRRRSSTTLPRPPPPSQRHRRKKRTPRYNSVSKIDRASRVVFPLCFLAINVFYWVSYLSRSEYMKTA